MAKEKNIQPEVVETDNNNTPEHIDIGYRTDIASLNDVVVLTANEYDCVVFTGKIPLDVAVAKAYQVLKVGGIFVVEKNMLHDSMDMILSLFDIKESNETSVVFVKAN